MSKLHLRTLPNSFLHIACFNSNKTISYKHKYLLAIVTRTNCYFVASYIKT